MLPFDDTSFPNLIEDGLNGGPNFPVTILKRRNGTENRIAARKNPIYSFNVGPLIQNESALLLVSNFYAARNGSARAFRFKDWADFTTAPDDVSLPFGPQTGPPSVAAYGVDQPVIPVNGVLTLYKNYSDSQGYLYQRRVFKPRPETFILMSGGSVVPPSSYTLNHILGTVTTSVGGSLTWGGTFDISARFTPDSDQLFSITWEAFSKGSASITVESVDYYGSGAQFVSGTYYIPVQSVDQGPTGTGEPANGGPTSGGGGGIALGGSPEEPVVIVPCFCPGGLNSHYTVSYTVVDDLGTNSGSYSGSVSLVGPCSWSAPDLDFITMFYYGDPTCEWAVVFNNGLAVTKTTGATPVGVYSGSGSTYAPVNPTTAVHGVVSNVTVS